MTVNCQEAMVEAQASDRIAAPASGASAATIESLRARLLSERAASKEARQQAHSIAQKVSELQTRLEAEIECRKKAEVAMNEVLEVLKVKGLAMEQIVANTYLPSESPASEEAAPIRGSKDGESDQSSVEEAMPAHMEDKCRGSTNSQGSFDDTVLTEDSVLEHPEGSISEDSSSDKTQVTLEDTSGSDATAVEREDVNRDEEGSSHEQGLLNDPSKAHFNVSLLSAEGGESDSIEQSSELVCDVFEGKGNEQRSGEAGQSIANGLPCVPSSNQVNAHQENGLMATFSEQLSDGQQVDAHVREAPYSSNVESGQQVDAHANEAPYSSNVERLNGMRMPVTENLHGLRSKQAHPNYINSGYPFHMPHMYAEKVHNVSAAEAPFSRGLVNFSSTAYQSREHVNHKAAELGRYSQAPISDAILSLIDDKNGKLGSILMALQLAKQQLKEEEQASSYMEEKFETPLPIPFDGKPYPGFYEAVPYQPPYRPWKPEAHNTAPIVHFPMSPTSDHEVSPFERHDGLPRSRSTSGYYMPGYDPYFQPKGELHLGNGITLYTD